MTGKGTLRTCPRGHTYAKSSTCPTCPVCEKQKTPADPRMTGISAPARRALESIRVKTLEQLAGHREAEVLALHGMGPKALGILKAAMKKAKLTFRAPAFKSHRNS